MAAPELPLEVWFRILASVPQKEVDWDGEHGKALGACALTCRSWLEEARHCLYRRVVVWSWRHYFRLSHTLTQNPALAALVCELHLWIDCGFGYGYTQFYYTPFNTHVIGLLVNLQDLAVQTSPGHSFPDNFLSFVWTFATCRSLRTLRLLGLKFEQKTEFDRTLWSFPDVTTLQVSECQWEYVEADFFIDDEYSQGTKHFDRFEHENPRFAKYDFLDDDDLEEEGTTSPRWYPYRTLDNLEICTWKGVKNTLLTFGPRVRKLSLRIEPRRALPRVNTIAIREYVDLEHLTLEFRGTDTAWVPKVLSDVRAKNLQTLRLAHRCERGSREAILEAWDKLNLDDVLAGHGYLSNLRHLSLCFVWSETETEDAGEEWSEKVRSLLPQCTGLFEMEITTVIEPADDDDDYW